MAPQEHRTAVDIAEIIDNALAAAGLDGTMTGNATDAALTIYDNGWKHYVRVQTK